MGAHERPPAAAIEGPRAITRIAALAALVVLGWCAREPRLSAAERARLAARFAFTRLPLPAVPGPPPRTLRTVHPTLTRIASWISGVGAAAALHDLDGDGLPNDVCYVESRTDQVIVAPLPGTPPRYPAFALDLAPHLDAATMAPMGCLPGDLDEDGRADLVIYFWGRPPLLLRHDGAPGPLAAARYRPSAVATGDDAGARWFTNAATLADLDGDGHLDLYIGNYFQDGARILDAGAHDPQAMHDGKSKAFNGGLDHLFLWAGRDGDGAPRFVEAHDALDDQISRQWTLAVGAADLDGDLLPELYLAEDYGPDRLLHNESTPGHLAFRALAGRASFTTPASFVLGADSFKGMGVDFGDLDGDGVLDLFVSNLAETRALPERHFAWIADGPMALMRSGRAPYRQASEALGLARGGWAWEARLGDFDNDGVLEALQATGFVRGDVDRWPELQALGTSNDRLLHDARFWPAFRPGVDLSGGDTNPFFVRAADGRYYDVADLVGVGEPAASRGIATADVDGDGRLDFVVANQFAPSTFYRNTAPRPGQFLGLHLLVPLAAGAPFSHHPGHPRAGNDGALPGRPAVGALVTARTSDGRRLVASVDGGNGHSGKRSPDVLLGLGDLGGAAITPVPVELRWRDAHGTPRRRALTLAPGWHTVLLGSGGGEADDGGSGGRP